jgi:hypothetical protein
MPYHIRFHGARNSLEAFRIDVEADRFFGGRLFLECGSVLWGEAQSDCPNCHDEVTAGAAKV